MRSTLLTCFSIFLAIGSAHSFAPSRPKTSTTLKPIVPRGGATIPLSSLPVAALGEAMSVVSSTLQSGPYGVLALSAVTWSVVLPLTLYKKVYGIGVAYGFSVFAAGLALLQVFSGVNPAAAGPLLAGACMFYGARLGGYLLLRDAVRNQPSTIKNGSIPSRITFSLSLALFYAFLTTPAMYALRAPVTSTIAMAGAYLAWFGAVVEAVADAQKLLVKQANKDSGGTFVGPTSLVYRISRHPNYLGEVLFWVGLFVGGAPSFGKSIPAWACSILGVVGIVSIMTKSTSGLEKKQAEKYGGQDKYETYKSQVKWPLLPFVK
jgi:steroid 5-alpha reductase family enzyme